MKAKKYAFLIAPAHHVKNKYISNAKYAASVLGLKLKFKKSIKNKYLYYAGTPERRAKEIEYAFLDKNVEVILSAVGGNGTLEVLPYIDFEIIKNNPKTIIGFSDITILLNSIYQRTNLIVVHGPNQTRSWKHLSLNEINSIKNCINKQNFGFKFHKKDVRFLKFGAVHGVTAGGCLSLLVDSLKTPFEIECKDKILFLEDTDVLGRRLYTLLVQLYLSGKLTEAKLVVLGSFYNCEYGIEYVLAFFNKYRIPYIHLDKFGHGYRNFAFPIGAKCVVDTEKCNISFIF